MANYNRKFVPRYMGLVKGRPRNLQITAGVQDEIEALMTASGMLENAPFSCVGLMYKFGLGNKFAPIFRSVHTNDHLPLTIEIKTTIVQWADEHNLQLLKDMFMIAGLEALLHVCDKFNLPKSLIFAERLKYWNVPETEEDCENMYGRDNKVQGNSPSLYYH